jgi:hypothetical protein
MKIIDQFYKNLKSNAFQNIKKNILKNHNKEKMKNQKMIIFIKKIILFKKFKNSISKTIFQILICKISHLIIINKLIK